MLPPAPSFQARRTVAVKPSGPAPKRSTGQKQATGKRTRYSLHFLHPLLTTLLRISTPSAISSRERWE